MEMTDLINPDFPLSAVRTVNGFKTVERNWSKVGLLMVVIVWRVKLIVTAPGPLLQLVRTHFVRLSKE